MRAAVLSCTVALSSALPGGQKSSSRQWRRQRKRGARLRTSYFSCFGQQADCRVENWHQWEIRSCRWQALSGIPRKTQEPALLACLVDGGCTIRLRRTLLQAVGSTLAIPHSFHSSQPHNTPTPGEPWRRISFSRKTSHSSGMMCQVRAGDWGFDFQEPSSLAGSPTSTVRFFLTSQHLLSITKKYMLVLDTCPLRNAPFPCAD